MSPVGTSQLLVATRSHGKQAEFRELLASLPYEIVFSDDLGLLELPEESGLEPFDKFEANAAGKARYFARRSGLLTLADDSGLEVRALHGAPGVRSKRYAGIDGPDHLVSAANNAALLKALADFPEEKRVAQYRCALVLHWPGKVGEIYVEGITAGRILEVPQGEAGFGYDPLFFSTDLGKSFGESTAEEKHGVSHRGKAVQMLIQRVMG